MTTTATEIETLAREIAEELGLPVKVSARECVYSAKLGRQIRVTVRCSKKRQTWKHTVAIGRELGKRIEGRAFQDRKSHRESRIGATGSTVGYVTGSMADIRVYPEAR